MAGPPKKLLGKPSEDSDEDDDDDDDDDVDDDDDDDDDVAAPPLEGMYDPSEFENLNVQVRLIIIKLLLIMDWLEALERKY